MFGVHYLVHDPIERCFCYINFDPHIFVPHFFSLKVYLSVFKSVIRNTIDGITHTYRNVHIQEWLFYKQENKNKNRKE